METLNEDASKLMDDLSEDEFDSAFSRVVNPVGPAPRIGVAGTVVEAGERLHSLVSRSEVQQLAEDELARARAAAEPVEWFFADGGRPSGPFDLEEVRERWAQGQIGPDTVCWGEGLTGWMPICRVPALAELLAPPPAETADLSAAVPQEHVEAPRASEALKELIEESAPVALAPAPIPIAPSAPEPKPVAAPPIPIPMQAIATAPVKHGVSHGRVALYVALSATIGAIAGGALVGLFAMQLLRFLPGGGAATPVPTVPAPASVAAAPSPTTPAVLPPPPVAKRAPAVPTPAPAPVAAAPSPKAPAAPPSAETKPADPPKHASEPVAEHRPEPHHARPAEPAPAPKKAEKPAPKEDDDGELIEAAAAAPAPAESASTPEIADAFDQAFGSAPEEKAKPSKSGKAVYVPPAPGKAPKAQLGQSDIMQVVVANKDQVVKCLNAARATQPDLSGKLMMRWTVTPSGEADSVEVLPGELADSELAHCVTRAIEGWKFPQHSAEQAPITFPFVF